MNHVNGNHYEVVTCITDKHCEGACASFCQAKNPMPKWNMKLRKGELSIKDKEIYEVIDMPSKSATGIIPTITIHR